MTPEKYAQPYTARKMSVKWRAKGILPPQGSLRVYDVNGVATTVSDRGRLSGILSTTTVA